MNKLNSTLSHTADYQLAGLRIVSDLSLSGLLLGNGSAADEVATIRRAPVPVTLPPPVKVLDEAEYNGAALLFTVPQVARYLIRGGSEILVDAEPSANQGDIRAYLLGSAFGTLCHQRGILPLHSAAIDIVGGCVAFIGPSGAGKSTLAATLFARGHQVIADDVSFIRLDSNRDVMSWPGIGRIRLWEDAVVALGCNGPGVEREFRGYNKYLVPVQPPADSFSPRRLRGIYHLEAAPAGCAASITRVKGASAIELLMQNVYCSSYAELMGYRPTIFSLCATVARQIPIFSFSRPIGFEELQGGLNILEDHLNAT